MNSKYTKENLRPIIKDCTSIHDCLKVIGLKPGGHKYLRKLLRKLLKELLIEQGTYLGQLHGKTKGKFRKENSEVFKNPSTLSSGQIKRHLFSRNLKEKVCESCGLDKWLNGIIPLECHHIDGNKHNNKIENLQILCPNCHVLTDTYRGKNIKSYN